MNLATGDFFGNKRWRSYYDIESGRPKYGYFWPGCLIGVLIDMDRGTMNFYKDAIDLGQAFIHPDLKTGRLHPFVLCKQKCELSLFHPFVYPGFRTPWEIEQAELKKKGLLLDNMDDEEAEEAEN